MLGLRTNTINQSARFIFGCAHPDDIPRLQCALYLLAWVNELDPTWVVEQYAQWLRQLTYSRHLYHFVHNIYFNLLVSNRADSRDPRWVRSWTEPRLNQGPLVTYTY